MQRVHSVLVDSTGKPYSEENKLPVGATVSVSPVESVPKNVYGEITGLLAEESTTIVSYVAPANKKSFLLRVETSGDTLGIFEVQINGVTEAKQRNGYMNFNVVFDFNAAPIGPGLPLSPGDQVTVIVIHSRPTLASFNARIQTNEL